MAANDPTALLSVVVPTFRREQQLERAVRSVLDEEIPGCEIVVVDDAPERSARDTIAPYARDGVRYETMPVPTGGRPALVRNHAIRWTRGTHLYFLDDDDTVVPGGLRALLDELVARPGTGVAFGTVTCVGPDPEVRASYERWFGWAARTAGRLRSSSRLTVGTTMFLGTLIINSCCMIRRDLAVELGGYDPELEVYEDVEFFARGIRRAGHVFVDRPVLRYSTGLPSIIHGLGGDVAPIARSHRVMHDKYKRQHGQLEYRALQVITRSLPIERPPATTDAPTTTAEASCP